MNRIKFLCLVMVFAVSALQGMEAGNNNVGDVSGDIKNVIKYSEDLYETQLSDGRTLTASLWLNSRTGRKEIDCSVTQTDGACSNSQRVGSGYFEKLKNEYEKQETERKRKTELDLPDSLVYTYCIERVTKYSEDNYAALLKDGSYIHAWKALNQRTKKIETYCTIQHSPENYDGLVLSQRLHPKIFKSLEFSFNLRENLLE